MTRALAAFVGMTLALSPLQAELFVGEGATGLASLKIPTSARAAAMSGAFSSVSADVSAMEYNPAGLANFTRTDVLASYISYIEDTSLQSLSIGFPVRFGSQKQAMADNTGEMFLENRLGVGLQYRVFSAEDTERTNTGVKIGDFDVRDQVLAVGVAYPFGPRLSLGLSGKYIGSKIQNESANTFALDTGAQYKLNDRWTLATALQNLGSGKEYRTEKDPLPSLLRVGVSREVKNFLLSLDVSEGRDEILKQALGAEFSLGNYVKLRGGLHNDSQIEFSGGLGVRFAGPQKAPVLQAPRKQAGQDNADSPQKKPLVVDNTITSPRMKDLYKNLAGQYKTLAETVDNPKVIVFPMKSNALDAGEIFTDLLSQQFSADDAFVVTSLEEKNLPSGNPNTDAAVEIAKRLEAQLILMGSVEKIDDSYLLNARLLDAEEGKILANAYEEVPATAIRDPNKKNTISDVHTNRASDDSAGLRDTFSKTDIGLDYSLSTRNELGIIHTVSLRILY